MSIANFKKLAGALVLAGSATLAHAAPITYSDDFTVSGSPGAVATHQNGVTTTGRDTQSSSVTFSGFDSTLGTLTGVTLDFTSNWVLDGLINASYSNTNDGANPALSAKGSVGGNYTVSIGGASLATQSIKNEFCYGAGSCDSNDFSNMNAPQNAPIGDDFTNKISILSDLNRFIDQTVQIDFSQLLTASLASCSLAGNAPFDDQTTCNLSNGDNSFWTGNVTISYAYDSGTGGQPPVTVSEPGAIALLGLGLMGLGLSRRKPKA